jgi:hypothetical protein
LQRPKSLDYAAMFYRVGCRATFNPEPIYFVIPSLVEGPQPVCTRPFDCAQGDQPYFD